MAKFTVSFLLLVFVTFSSVNSRKKRPVPLRDNVRMGHFTQKLDHFNSSDLRTWNQYYWVNDKYHRAGGPAFVYLEGEGATDEDSIDSGKGWQMTDWGIKYGAIIFELEHRYFGRSIPLHDYKTENLRWLNSKQAIEDIASFVKEMNKLYNLDDPKWIVFGGSYAGSLTAWVREIHPELITGAVSSSGSILAKMNDENYLRVVNESFWSYSPECVKEIDKAFRKVEKMITTEQGRQELKEKLDLCSDIPEHLDEKDMGQLFLPLLDIFQEIAQYGGDNTGEYYYNLTIPHSCQLMLNSSNYPDVIDRLAILSKKTELQRFNSTGCLEFQYSQQLEKLRNTDPYNHDMTDRGWNWICCGEMGWLQTSNHPSHPFGNHTSLKWFLNQCKDMFGPTWSPLRLHKQVKATNKYYGGVKHYRGTNVVLLNGSQDPCYVTGVYEPIEENPDATVVFMKGAAHCADVYGATENDLESVTNARIIIEQHIKKWLQL